MRSSMHTGRGEIASLNENESGKFVKILGTTMAPQPSGSLGCSRCPLEQCHISNTDCQFIFVLQMFNKANVVGILIKAKKHGLVFFDGEIVFAVSS